MFLLEAIKYLSCNEDSKRDEYMNFFNDLLQRNLIEVVEEIYNCIAFNNYEENTIISLILLFIRVLEYRFTRYFITDNVWNKSEIRIPFREILLHYLGHPNIVLRNSVSYSIAKIVAKEIPAHLWESFYSEIIDTIISSESSIYIIDGAMSVLIELTNVVINNSQFIRVPFISSQNPDYEKLSLVVFQICNDMMFKDFPDSILHERAVFLFSSYISHFSFVKNDYEQRYTAIHTILQAIKLFHTSKLLSKVFDILTRFVLLYYECIEDIFEDLFNELWENLICENIEIVIETIDFWARVSCNELQLLTTSTIKNSLIVPHAEDFSKVLLQYLDYAPPEIPEPEEGEKSSVYRSSHNCISFLIQLSIESVFPLVQEHYNSRINSGNQYLIQSALLSVYSLIPVKCDELVSSFIQENFSVFYSATMVEFDWLREISLFLISVIIKDAAFFIPTQEDLIKLLETMENNIDRHPALTVRAFELLSNLADLVSPECENSVLSENEPKIFGLIVQSMNSPNFNHELVIIAVFESFNAIIQALPIALDLSPKVDFVHQCIVSKLGGVISQKDALCISLLFSVYSSIIEKVGYQVSEYSSIIQKDLIVTFQSTTDPCILSEAFITADFLLLTLSPDESSLFALSIIDHVQHSLYSYNINVICKALLVLNSIARKTPYIIIGCERDIFEKLDEIIKSDYFQIHHSVYFLMCIQALIVAFPDSFINEISRVLVLNLGFSRFEFDTYDEEQKGFACELYCAIIDCYTAIIETYYDERDLLLLNMKQFVGIVNPLFSLWPVNSRFALITMNYIKKLGEFFGNDIGTLMMRSKAFDFLVKCHQIEDNRNISEQAKKIMSLITHI